MVEIVDLFILLKRDAVSAGEQGLMNGPQGGRLRYRQLTTLGCRAGWPMFSLPPITLSVLFCVCLSLLWCISVVLAVEKFSI